MLGKRVVVVGAGPAGMMAAIRAGECKAQVLLLEKNLVLGKKLLLSGKGRCNITNACGLESFLEKFSHNAEFLRDAFGKFFNKELIGFFEKRGLPLKVERQERVFPVTDKSASVIAVLNSALRQSHVKVIFDCKVRDILVKDGRVNSLLLAGGKSIFTDKIILATGGASYSFTGSDSFGISLAEKLGHNIVSLKSGLAPIEVKQNYPKLLEGLTLKNISVSISGSKKEFRSPVGELLFTDFGISGPLVFSLSAKVGDWLKNDKDLRIEVDLKPGLSVDTLDARLLREFKLNSKKSIENILNLLLPKRMSEVCIGILKLDGVKKASYVTAEERAQIVSFLKSFRMDIKRIRPIEEGMVTRGGVSLKDINPRTMESLKVKGLYFAGEMIDVDADTGGFNLQAAFSTGYLAGESAAL